MTDTSKLPISRVDELIDKLNEINNNISEINNKLDSMTYVVESWNEGTEWYRIWSDGYIEQGGRISLNETSTKDITYLKPFNDTNYCLLAIQTTQSTAGDTEVGIQFTPVSNTIGRLSCHYINPNTTTVSWKACGY